METLFSAPPAISIATAQMVEERLHTGDVRLTIKTASMSPALHPGDQVLVRKMRRDRLHIGDIVVLKSAGTLVAHRLIAFSRQGRESLLITKGDNTPDADAPCEALAAIGVVAAVTRGQRETSFQTFQKRAINRLLALLSYGHWMATYGKQATMKRVSAKGLRAGIRVLAALLAMLFVLFLALPMPGASAAVKISALSAKPLGNQIKVTWTTGNEINNIGFNLLRSTLQNGPYTKLNSTIIPSQCLGCLAGSNYVFSDASAALGQTYYYKLQSVETTGRTQDFGPVSASIGGTTSTPVATATRTATRATSTIAVGTPTSGAATFTRESVPSISLSTRVPTGTPNSSVPVVTPQTKVAFAVGASSATPQAKVAYAAGIPTAAPVTGASARDASTSRVEPTTVAAGDIRMEEGEARTEELPVEQPATPESGYSALLPIATFGLAGLFGCCSLISAFFAIVLCVRTYRR